MSQEMENVLKRIGVTITKPVHALITILFGIFVWLIPQFLSFLLGSYFIISGILLLIDYYGTKNKTPQTNGN